MAKGKKKGGGRKSAGANTNASSKGRGSNFRDPYQLVDPDEWLDTLPAPNEVGGQGDQFAVPWEAYSHFYRLTDKCTKAESKHPNFRCLKDNPLCLKGLKTQKDSKQAINAFIRSIIGTAPPETIYDSLGVSHHIAEKEKLDKWEAEQRALPQGKKLPQKSKPPAPKPCCLRAMEDETFHLQKQIMLGHDSTDATNDPKGLLNLSNTCYLNSVLQALFWNPNVRRAILNVKPRQEVLKRMLTLLNEKEQKSRNQGKGDHLAAATTVVIDDDEESSGDEEEGAEKKTKSKDGEEGDEQPAQDDADEDGQVLGQGGPTTPQTVEEAVAGLQRIFAELEVSNLSAPSTQPLVSALEITPSIQQDSQEFLNLFLTMLMEAQDVEEVKKADQEGSLRVMAESIRREFQGSVLNIKTCTNCQKKYHRHEPFVMLEMPVTDLEQGLKERVMSQTFVENYFCEGCETLANLTGVEELKALPNTLIFHLMRFEFDMVKLSRKKVHTAVNLPHYLDMRKYMPKSSATDDDPAAYLYELVTVVNHLGKDPTHGHYTCDVKEFRTEGFPHPASGGGDSKKKKKAPSETEAPSWYNCDDSEFTTLPAKKYDHRAEAASSKDAYLAFYRRVENNGCSKEALEEIALLEDQWKEAQPVVLKSIEEDRERAEAERKDEEEADQQPKKQDPLPFSKEKPVPFYHRFTLRRDNQTPSPASPKKSPRGKKSSTTTAGGGDSPDVLAPFSETYSHLLQRVIEANHTRSKNFHDFARQKKSLQHSREIWGSICEDVFAYSNSVKENSRFDVAGKPAYAIPTAWLQFWGSGALIHPELVDLNDSVDKFLEKYQATELTNTNGKDIADPTVIEAASQRTQSAKLALSAVPKICGLGLRCEHGYLNPDSDFKLISFTAWEALRVTYGCADIAYPLAAEEGEGGSAGVMCPKCSFQRLTTAQLRRNKVKEDATMKQAASVELENGEGVLVNPNILDLWREAPRTCPDEVPMPTTNNSSTSDDETKKAEEEEEEGRGSLVGSLLSKAGALLTGGSSLTAPPSSSAAVVRHHDLSQGLLCPHGGLKPQVSRFALHHEVVVYLTEYRNTRFVVSNAFPQGTEPCHECMTAEASETLQRQAEQQQRADQASRFKSAIYFSNDKRNAKVFSRNLKKETEKFQKQWLKEHEAEVRLEEARAKEAAAEAAKKAEEEAKIAEQKKRDEEAWEMLQGRKGRKGGRGGGRGSGVTKEEAIKVEPSPAGEVAATTTTSTTAGGSVSEEPAKLSPPQRIKEFPCVDAKWVEEWHDWVKRAITDTTPAPSGPIPMNQYICKHNKCLIDLDHLNYQNLDPRTRRQHGAALVAIEDECAYDDLVNLYGTDTPAQMRIVIREVDGERMLDPPTCAECLFADRLDKEEDRRQFRGAAREDGINLSGKIKTSAKKYDQVTMALDVDKSNISPEMLWNDLQKTIINVLQTSYNRIIEISSWTHQPEGEEVEMEGKDSRKWKVLNNEEDRLLSLKSLNIWAGDSIEFETDGIAKLIEEADTAAPPMTRSRAGKQEEDDIAKAIAASVEDDKAMDQAYHAPVNNPTATSSSSGGGGGKGKKGNKKNVVEQGFFGSKLTGGGKKGGGGAAGGGSPPPQQESSSAPKECPVCTYHNDAIRTLCEMCETPLN